MPLFLKFKKLWNLTNLEELECVSFFPTISCRLMLGSQHCNIHIIFSITTFEVEKIKVWKDFSQAVLKHPINFSNI
jgi:hypothetical protein